MSILNLIIKREFVSKVRNKSFVIMTFVSPLIMVGFAVLVGFFANINSKEKNNYIGIHDESGLFVNAFKNTDQYQYYDVSTVDKNVLQDSVTSGFYTGVLYIPKKDNIEDYEQEGVIQFISEESPKMNFIYDIEHTLENKLTSEKLTLAGLDTEAINKAQAKVNIGLEKSSGEETVKGLNEIKIILGILCGYLLMMFIVVYGNMVMRSVIEEKTNRIIEIIISSVKPMQLMMGKIIGTSLAGLLQFIIWIAIGGILLVIGQIFFGEMLQSTPSAEMISATAESINDAEKINVIQGYIKEILNLPILTMIVSFLFFFIGGYLLYSSLYAAIGAAVDNETDTQQFMFPVIAPLALAVYVGMATVVENPHGTVAMIFSYIPFTSPIVMLMRIPFGVPIWEIVVSLTLLYLSFLAAVWLASKIYRVGILSYGKKPSWKDLYKWLRY